jgi:radical SAM protein with 4Fe4S-binding SPASM domain
VAPDGTFYGCTKLAFAGRGKERPLPLGNVFEGFIEEENRLTLLNHTEKVRPKCRECTLAKRCNGGCYAANFTDSGNIFTASDTYCKLIFAQMAAADYARHRLRELGLKNVSWHTGEQDDRNSDAS